MPLTFDTYDVAYFRDGKLVESEVTVYKSDELRAELEGRRFGLKGPSSDGKTVTDLGDHLNLEALKLWAALVRREEYEGKSNDFRLRDCLEFKKHKGADDKPKSTPVDPTRPDTNTESGSLAPPSSEDSDSGSTLT